MSCKERAIKILKREIEILRGQPVTQETDRLEVELTEVLLCVEAGLVEHDR